MYAKHIKNLYLHVEQYKERKQNKQTNKNLQWQKIDIKNNNKNHQALLERSRLAIKTFRL